MINLEQKQHILVVDDIPENIDVIVNILGPDYDIQAAINGEKALKIANSTPKPDMILLDIMMPNLSGFDVCRQLKSNPATSDIPIIFVTGKDEVADEELGFKLGAVDYITKPISPSIVMARVKTHLALYDQKRNLAQLVNARTSELNQTRLTIIQKLGRAAEYKDNETGFHVIRMSYYARLIAKAYGGNDEWVEMVFNAAPMHDIGKIGIPDHILTKPGKLTKEEWGLMQKHSEFGAIIIGNDPSPLLQLSKSIALHHHEKWDGSGYPHQLSGDEIPLEARIIAIADVFDALTSERPYKKAWTVEDAVNLINDSNGTHFEPKIVDMFHIALPEILKIKEKYHEKDSQING
ncbi:MAG: response regulator [Methylococcales bacterium]|jgi:putative two-component system response regulator|nr:response regulator [Methylococcales bacterium]